MLNTLFASVITTTVNWQAILLCTLSSLILGIAATGIYCYKNMYTKSFVVTLALLPAMVQIVIMLVNGNLGTGVAVAGAFSLVRFRSVPGNSREIASIFLAMAVGLATGMGYVAIGGLLVTIVGMVMLLVANLPVGRMNQMMRDLKVTIPENLDYEGIFDDLFAEYTTRNELLKVRTVNMGSLYELHYHILFRGDKSEKKFLDELRCRNGNLTIVCGRVAQEREEL